MNRRLLVIVNEEEFRAELCGAIADEGYEIESQAYLCDYVVQQICTRLIFEEGLKHQASALGKKHGVELRQLRERFLATKETLSDSTTACASMSCGRRVGSRPN